MKRFQFSPITKKRLLRFRNSHVAFFSLKLLVTLYVISLFSELICNSSPLYLRYKGESHFPFLTNRVPESIMIETGLIHINYRDFAKTPNFTADPDNKIIFAPVPYGPNEVLDTTDLEQAKTVTVSMKPTQPIARFNLTTAGKVVRQDASKQFFPNTNLVDEQAALSDLITIPTTLQNAINQRFAGESAPAFELRIRPAEGKTYPWKALTLKLPPHIAGNDVPETIRVTLITDVNFIPTQNYTFTRTFARNTEEPQYALRQEEGELPPSPALLTLLTQYAKQGFIDNIFAKERITYADPETGFIYAITTSNNIRYPFHPTSNHIMGLDGSGRDVFARILYGMRMSVSFGLLLSTWAALLGMFIGALQGFFGSKVDICIQRFTEIWSSLPFLYIMILVGAVFGRSFWLLLFCYGLFSWIVMSIYMRGEFYRLRNRPFVDAARCLGLSNARIIFRHILPNALTPIITLFPFSLVGAIGALVSLDFLGFGLPPLTPSWGELLQQAQTYRWAWWLILFPSLAIFTVMFLTVMIGEGVRNAFDPKPYSKME